MLDQDKNFQISLSILINCLLENMDIIGRSYMLVTFGGLRVNHSATLPHYVMIFFRRMKLHTIVPVINLRHTLWNNEFIFP